MTKLSRFANSVVSARTPLKHYAFASFFLVPYELIQRPLTRAANKGVRTLTRATRFIYIQRARGARVRASGLSSKEKAASANGAKRTTAKTIFAVTNLRVAKIVDVIRYVSYTN